jgi:two-component system sensor histidine kinase AlgZ
VTSINQTGAGIRLPNFCNFGVMLRTLVLVNGLALAAAVLRARGLPDVETQFLIVAAYTEPVLVASLLVACAARRPLYALGYVPALAALATRELALVWGWALAFDRLLPLGSPPGVWQLAFFTLFATGVTLAYFDLRSRALSPAVAEARIQALQARIRPHFLYNSINTVLSLIRKEPKRAERALEDLASLFRVLMVDDRSLQPVAKEVEIARQYLAIEQLRLGDRLRIAWRTDEMPADALVPALLVQPLVENAVYHGIEPLEGGGEITMEVRKEGDRVTFRFANPYRPGGETHAGNRMALANIRERLQLHFDAEATLRTAHADGVWEVRIELPYIPAS